MNAFTLHPRLAEDTHALGALPSGPVLLHRNAAVPWLLLVPRTDAEALCDLPGALRRQVEADTDALCRLVRSAFPEVTRLNVAAIGNVVPQLHVHVVGRHPQDPCWPRPVWGHLEETASWSDERVRTLREALLDGS